MADPLFPHKLLFEQFVTISCSVRSELKNRKGGIKEEWDLALIKVLTVVACTLLAAHMPIPSALIYITDCRSSQTTYLNQVIVIENLIFRKEFCLFYARLYNLV